MSYIKLAIENKRTVNRNSCGMFYCIDLPVAIEKRNETKQIIEQIEEKTMINDRNKTNDNLFSIFNEKMY